MKETYLGDSYDVVKRFWADILRPIAKLYVHPLFIPDPIRTRFSLLTGMPLYDGASEELPKRFGIFLDPDTGIHLPSERIRWRSTKHASLEFIAELYEEIKPEYLICFDQSFKRAKVLNKREEMSVKCDALRNCGFASFYFDSHASFLFASQNAQTLVRIEEALVIAGIPSNRLYSNTLTEPRLA